MSTPDRIATFGTTYTKSILAVLLLTTALIGAGVPMVDDDSSLEQFESDSPEANAQERAEENFTADDDTTTVQLITRGENVLDRESLVDSLGFQQQIRTNESVNETLAEDDPITGVENIVATAAINDDLSSEMETGLDDVVALQREFEADTATLDEDDPVYELRAEELEADVDAVTEDVTAQLTDEQADAYLDAVEQAREITAQQAAIEQAADDPTDEPAYEELSEQLEQVYAAGTIGALTADESAYSLDEQIAGLQELNDEEYEDLIEETLSEDNGTLSLMASSYEPGSTQADARVTAITQSTDNGVDEMEGTDDEITESQLDLRELATDHPQDQLVFGAGIITDEIDRSMADSLTIVGPLALLFVVTALLIAYRDPLDIVLGVAGIVTVLVWTFGFMGWTGISFNQMFVAVPVLLIGLSIDYAIHVFMRHREQREGHAGAGDDGPIDTVRGSMAIALAGVGVALVWVTATTAIGFLSNLVSPIGPIREFGLVSAVGIVATLIVFGAMVPAAKIELDELLEARGRDRRKRAFGTGGGRFSTLLSAGSVGARRIPLVILIAVLLLTAGGVYGATQVDTSFEQEDFLADAPPEWTQSLPGPFSPGEYQAKSDLEYVNQEFQPADSNVQILLEDDVTDDEILTAIDDSRTDAAERNVTFVLPDGEADVEDPLTTMESVADRDESFNESFNESDTTGDGVPDENVSALYDDLFDADEEAAEQVISRSDDGEEYDAARLVIGVEGDADAGETTTEMRGLATELDDGGETRWSATATGDPIVGYIVEQDLLDTVLESLLITLVAVFLFLTVAYWLAGNGAILGAVTLLPVAVSVSWILGTMALIGMPFNVLTGMITSLTIGLGVAYSIHVSARYTLELDRQGNVWSALKTTVTGTGGALLGSAATTIGGFGTLVFAILPALRQFGIITGLTIAYAFLASVIVLPTLLVFWTRYFGPDVSFSRTETPGPAPAASDGGIETDSTTDHPTGDTVGETDSIDADDEPDSESGTTENSASGRTEE